ncbi:hypothetical protein CPC08DRAFT_748771 [Agrocybe pediades]|nr:hypothetical protein CPC08DRAFT_748771 [Agrocybe pediades]
MNSKVQELARRRSIIQELVALGMNNTNLEKVMEMYDRTKMLPPALHCVFAVTDGHITREEAKIKISRSLLARSPVSQPIESQLAAPTHHSRPSQVSENTHSSSHYRADNAQYASYPASSSQISVPGTSTPYHPPTSFTASQQNQFYTNPGQHHEGSSVGQYSPPGTNFQSQPEQRPHTSNQREGSITPTPRHQMKYNAYSASTLPNVQRHAQHLQVSSSDFNPALQQTSTWHPSNRQGISGDQSAFDRQSQPNYHRNGFDSSMFTEDGYNLQYWT